MPETMHECPGISKRLRVDCAVCFKNTLPIMLRTSFLEQSVKIHYYFIEYARALQAFYMVFSSFVQMPKDMRPPRQLSCRTPFAYNTASIWCTRSVQEHCSP